VKATSTPVKEKQASDEHTSIEKVISAISKQNEDIKVLQRDVKVLKQDHTKLQQHFEALELKLSATTGNEQITHHRYSQYATRIRNL